MPRTHGLGAVQEENPLLKDRGERRCGSGKLLTRKQNIVCELPEEFGPDFRRQNDCHWK